MTAAVDQGCRVTGVIMSCSTKKHASGNAKRLKPTDTFDFFKDHHQDSGPADRRGERSSDGNKNEAVYKPTEQQRSHHAQIASGAAEEPLGNEMAQAKLDKCQYGHYREANTHAYNHTNNHCRPGDVNSGQHLWKSCANQDDGRGDDPKEGAVTDRIRIARSAADSDIIPAHNVEGQT
jgi:hypothetical protein